MISLIKFFKKVAQERVTGVELMLEMFDCFIVYEEGPIMSYVLSLLGDLYGRLTNQQKSIFINTAIDKYISSV